MKTLLFAVTLLFLWAETALPAAAPEVTCGATLSRRTFTLTADLDCETATTPITVRDRAVLNLNNHTYLGVIVLDGSRAQLRDGTINCEESADTCIIIEGTGQHSVQNVLVRGQGSVGIQISSDNNSLTRNTVLGGGMVGIHVAANNNILQQNRVIFNDDGFNISGNENQLIGNYAGSNETNYDINAGGDNNILAENVSAGESDGFLVNGNLNRLSRNIATNSFGFGISVTGSSNTIENNIALQNAPDLEDTNTNCDSNVWEDNIFQTSNQTCIR